MKSIHLSYFVFLVFLSSCFGKKPTQDKTETRYVKAVLDSLLCSYILDSAEIESKLEYEQVRTPLFQGHITQDLDKYRSISISKQYEVNNPFQHMNDSVVARVIFEIQELWEEKIDSNARLVFDHELFGPVLLEQGGGDQYVEEEYMNIHLYQNDTFSIQFKNSGNKWFDSKSYLYYDNEHRVVKKVTYYDEGDPVDRHKKKWRISETKEMNYE